MKYIIFLQWPAILNSILIQMVSMRVTAVLLRMLLNGITWLPVKILNRLSVRLIMKKCWDLFLPA